MPESSILAVRNLAKRYGGVTALQDMNLRVERGAIHAVVGENGAGKSTLMKALAGVVRPDSGAIEMDGATHVGFDLIKGGMAKYGIKNPIFKPSPITPHYSDYLIFEGISVDEAGQQHYLDVHVAYRQACLNAIEYMTKFGYSRAQAYSILGTAPVQVTLYSLSSS